MQTNDNNTRDDKDRNIKSSDEAKSRTYNESEETFKKEKKKANTENDGTKNNNWDANNPMERR